MSVPKRSLIIVSTFLISSANAQIVYRRRRTSLGRIIAGCIVGGLFAIFFLCLCLMMQRRRRQRINPVPVGATNQSSGAKPLFGGPWGRNNQTQATYDPNNGQNHGTYNNSGLPYGANPHGSYQQQAPYNPEYPSQNAPAPPPAYGKEANYGQTYSPPAGPPPGNTSDQPYAPPPGPPPAAHTTGQDNTFIGGFRQ